MNSIHTATDLIHHIQAFDVDATPDVADTGIPATEVGNITLTGTDLPDTLVGTAGGDIINGLGGDDTIIGNGGGFDQLNGGDGSDLIIGGQTGGQTFESGGNGDDNMWAGAVGDAGINDPVSLDRLDGGAGNDAMHGVGNGLLTGDDGDDTLIAGSTGSGVGDDLRGGAGNDTLVSGQGNDSLTGGDGADTFVFNAADGGHSHDNVIDFVAGTDVVDLVGVGTSFDLAAHLTDNVGTGEAVLTLDNGATISFNDTAADLVAHASDFHIVS
ncbi:MAG: putative beta-lactamase [Bradyrhizobium sp.]|nr:putative beta-lactamase [Bradyrhizobium sp.]